MFGKVDAAAEVELDEAHGRHRDGEGDLQRVIAAEHPLGHALLDHLDHGGEGGRAFRAGVAQEPPGSLTPVGDQVAVQVRPAEREVQEVVAGSGQSANP